MGCIDESDQVVRQAVGLWQIPDIRHPGGDHPDSPSLGRFALGWRHRPGSDRRAARIPKGLARKVEIDVPELKAMRTVAIMIRDDFRLILRKYPEPNVAVV